MTAGRLMMNKISMRFSFIVGAFLLLSGPPSLTSGVGWYGSAPAFAATVKQKSQARKELNQVIADLRAVDTAYASGNAAEAQTRFEQARSAWNRVAPAISTREAREAQLMFDGLGAKLKNAAPPADVKSTVSGMLEELREDIAEELR
jgi:hypothetical protein